MNKKQKRNMLIKEALILATIGIIIGTLCGIAISYFGIRVLDILFSKSTENPSGAKFLIDPNIKFYMVIPNIGILVMFVITYFITLISAVLPIKKIDKYAAIDAIKGTVNGNTKTKKLKVPKIIKNIFKEPGVLAYKNIKKDKSKYKTIIISLTISLVLFITVNSVLNDYLGNYTEISNSLKDKKEIELDIVSADAQKNASEIMNYLEKQKLIEDYIGVCPITFGGNIHNYISIPYEKESDALKALIENGILQVYNNDNIVFYRNFTILSPYGTEYDEFLKVNGIDNLKEGECIIIDSIKETKYSKDKANTKYEAGDSIELFFTDKKLEYEKIQNEQEIDEEARKEEIEFFNQLDSAMGGAIKDSNQSEEIKKEEINITKKLTIKKVLHEFTNDAIWYNAANGMTIIVNQETVNMLYSLLNLKLEDSITNLMSKVYIDTNNINNTLQEIESIKENLRSNTNNTVNISTNNMYEQRMKQISETNAKRVIAYTFIGMIALFSIVNIFNTILSSVILRKREIASLKSTGMSKKQMNKMFLLEGIFYGLDSLVYGSLISTFILYMLYYKDETISRLYAFNYPWKTLLIAIFIVYVVIFIAISKARKKLDEGNIIDEIRNENI